MNNIIIKNLDNEMIKKCVCFISGIDMIFYVGIGSFLCCFDEKMVLFDF